MKQNAKICKKYVPLLKQNVMELEVFILGGQRIDGRDVERELREGTERRRDRKKRDKRELS